MFFRCNYLQFFYKKLNFWIFFNKKCLFFPYKSEKQALYLNK
jgi:hypothetical protein